MRLCSIAAAAAATVFMWDQRPRICLVDVGISGKKAEAGLNSLGLTGRDLDGILVTHEHMDHVAGLGVMARKYEVPIYATTGTLEEIQKMGESGQDQSSPVSGSEGRCETDYQGSDCQSHENLP